jgi:hypothetical protein
MMSTSSSSLPSTCHTMRGGASHLRSSRTFHQWRVRHPWRRRPQCCQVRARRRSTTCRWPATKRQTLGRKSTAVEEGRTVAPPSSTTARGVETSRVTTSRESSTCMHQWVRAKSHMHLSPLSPQEFQAGCMALAPHQKSTIGRSTPSSSCRFTPPPSSRQVGMRL